VLKSLRSRNVALLVAVVLAGQILSFALIWALAIRLQAERVGGIMALRRALTNLIRNATLYGCAPFLVELAKHGRCDIIRVIDHGDGVPEAVLADLARPFVRGSDARTSDGGTGLGLAIARHAAVSMGGTLRLSNRDGGGFVAEIMVPATGFEPVAP
jgi:signal transduction histidine kinase